MNGHVCSITGGTVSRRDFLLSLLSLLAAPAAVTGAAGAVPTHDLPPWLAAISGRPEAVLRFGTAYLQLYPEERDREAIIAAIESRMACQNCARVISRSATRAVEVARKLANPQKPRPHPQAGESHSCTGR